MSPPGWPKADRDRDLANQWVERLQAMAEKHPSRIVIVVADMARADPPLSSAFVAEFCQRLSRLNPVLHLARNWLEQRTLEQGLSVEQLVHQESQSQASDQVSVSHSISSLRLLSAIDWKEFVETLSLVEQTCAASRPMFTATWILRRAIVIATSLKPSPVTVRSQKSKWRAKPSSWRRKVRNRKGAKIAPRTSVFI